MTIGIDKSNWCGGCGDHAILKAFAEAVINSGLDPEDIRLATDIGCFGRVGFKRGNKVIAKILKMAHALHGRSPNLASGGKISDPDKFFVVAIGDGGATAIGRSDFEEICQMNVSVLIVVANNYIFAMTGGQKSPTTEKGMVTTTYPYEITGKPVDICRTAKIAGATFVARSTTNHISHLRKVLEEAIDHVRNMRGAAVVDIRTQCPTRFGKNNNMSTMQMLLHFGECAVMNGNLEEEYPEGKFPIGIFFKKENSPDFTEQHKKLITCCILEEHKKPFKLPVIETAEVTLAPLPKMKPLKIFFAGEAGQGVDKMADVLSRAVIIKDKRMHSAKHATHEATVRGGPSSSSVVIHNEQIKSGTVQVENADIIMVIKKGLHDLSGVKKDAIIIDSEVFSAAGKSANMAALGFLLQNERLKNIVDISSLQKGILAVFGERFKESNFKALEVGKNYLVS